MGPKRVCKPRRSRAAQREPVLVEPKFLDEKKIDVESSERLHDPRQALGGVGKHTHREPRVEGCHPKSHVRWSCMARTEMRQ
jgi:hypothetical protein